MRHRKAKNMKYQFDAQTRQHIYFRDNGACIFCRRRYHMENRDEFLYSISDVMHYINKSQGGLGIPQNGAIGCRYHHGLLDNGNKGTREEMLNIFREHLVQQYPDWNEEELVYRKWDFPAFE